MIIAYSEWTPKSYIGLRGGSLASRVRYPERGSALIIGKVPVVRVGAGDKKLVDGMDREQP